jgi:hypothetical protein
VLVTCPLTPHPQQTWTHCSPPPPLPPALTHHQLAQLLELVSQGASHDILAGLDLGVVVLLLRTQTSGCVGRGGREALSIAQQLVGSLNYYCASVGMAEHAQMLLHTMYMH